MRRNYLALVLLLLLGLQYDHGIQIFPVQALTWSAPSKLTPSLTVETKPYVAENGSGALWTVWESYRSSNWDLYGRWFDGVSWLTEERLTNHTARDQTPAWVQLADGGNMLAWASDRSGEYAIYSKTLRAGVWSPETQIPTGSGKESNPALLQSRNGTLWLLWMRETFTGVLNRDIYYKTNTNGIWSPEVPFASTAAYETGPSIFEAEDGTVWIAYASSISGNEDVYYRTFNGVWSSEKPLTSNRDDDRQPWIMQDLNETVWMFWSRCVGSGPNCQDDIFYRTSNNLGVSWSAEVQFTFDPQGADAFDIEPAAIHARNKKIYLFWTSSIKGDGGDFDVYYSASDPILIHNLAVGELTVPEDRPRSGEAFTVTVSVENRGDFLENLMLNVTIDGSSIGLTPLTLLPGQSSVRSYSWSSAGQALGLHRLEAAVGAVPGERRVTDNVATFDFYVVSAGDVNKDGAVNFLDLGAIGSAFLSQVGVSRYDPRADVSPDGKIDFLDLGTTGFAFGQSVVLPPDFNLAASSYIVRVSQGSSNLVLVAVESVSGFNSPVLLNAAGFGSGLTASFSANPVTAPGESSLTFTASTGTVTGTFKVTVTGTSGVRTKTLNLTLVVTPPGTFSLAVQPPSVTLPPRGSSQSAITLSSAGNFNSPVTLTASGLPAGLQAIFDPNPVAPPPNGVITSTLTFDASSTVTPGNYTVTITATSGGIVQSLNVPVEVCIPLQGDVNHDGFVNFLDLGRIGAAFLTITGDPGFDPDADLNNDGAINFLDLAIVGAGFMKQC